MREMKAWSTGERNFLFEKASPAFKREIINPEIINMTQEVIAGIIFRIAGLIMSVRPMLIRKIADSWKPCISEHFSWRFLP